MTYECSKCDGYLQFYEELHFKYYNSAGLLLLDRLLWNGCCEEFVEKTSWVFTSNDPDEYRRFETWLILEMNSKWCQRVCRFELAVCLLWGMIPVFLLFSCFLSCGDKTLSPTDNWFDNWFAIAHNFFKLMIGGLSLICLEESAIESTSI